MKFLGLAAVALTLTVSASAGTILNFCSGWSASAGGAIFFTAPIAIDSGTINCSAYGSLPVGDTFVSEQLVLLTDYSGGLGTTQNAIAATYSGTGLSTDTLTSSSGAGNGNSNTYGDTFGINYAPLGATAWLDATTLSDTFTPLAVNFSANATLGNVQSASGQVYELITYQLSAPEPASMLLLGGGLLAISLVGRKKFIRK